MLALVLDTSTPAVSAALVSVGSGPGELLAERVVVDGRRHGELLAVGVQEVLRVGTPDVVVVGVGPGPFTGLRVGIVTAAAFGSARGLPVLGVCSLDGLGGPGLGVVTDARRREVYWAAYDDLGARVQGPVVSTPVVAAQALAGRPLVGAGAQLYTDVLGGGGGVLYPSLVRLAEVAVHAHLAGEPALALTPLYLRRPDATEPGAAKKVTA